MTRSAHTAPRPVPFPRARWAALSLLCGAPLLGACRTERVTAIGPTAEILAERTLPDGTEQRWRLQHSAGDPLLEVRTRRSREVAFLGLSVKELPREQAEALGETPWSGLVVERVNPGSAADKAGIWPGDVLVSLGGQPLMSSQAFSERVDLELTPGVAAQFEARRGGEARQFSVIPESRRIEDSTTDTLSLEGSAAVGALTGMTVGALEPAQAQAIFESPEGLLVIAGIQPGSPAYLAGLRSGDRIAALDGRSPVALSDLVAAVLSRAEAKRIQVSSNERPRELPERPAGPLVIDVEGPLGHHRAELEPKAGLERRRTVDIPILYECHSETESSSWSFLDFIFQFGGNGSARYLPSKDRRPARSSYLSLLPFGLYEHERGPERSRYELLWFIEWGSDR
jgi:hypothetical protein